MMAKYSDMPFVFLPIGGEGASREIMKKSGVREKAFAFWKKLARKLMGRS